MHCPVLVIAKPDDNLEDLMYPFYEGAEVEPYISKTKDELIQEAKSRVDWLKGALKDDPKAKVSDFDKGLLNAKDDESLYEAYREDDFYNYDDEGNLVSTYNPYSKWDWYEEGGRYSDALKFKSGNRGYQCLFKDLDADDDDEAYYSAMNWWYEKIESGNSKLAESYISDYGTADNYARNQCKFHLYQVLKNGIWTDFYDENISEFEWADNFKKRFLSDCEDDDVVIVVDCHI